MQEGDDSFVKHSSNPSENSSKLKEIHDPGNFDDNIELQNNNNSLNYYGSKVLSGPDNPSVGNRGPEHRKTEEEKETYSSTDKNPFMGSTCSNNATQWVIQPPTVETRLYESQIQQDEMYNTLKSKTNTLNPQL